ncbi:phage DNA packaging protein J [Streptomyces sp. NPDC056373]
MPTPTRGLCPAHDTARAGRLSPLPGNSGLRAHLRLNYVKGQVSATL